MQSAVLYGTAVFSSNVTGVDQHRAHRSFDSGEYPMPHPRGALLKLRRLDMMTTVMPERFGVSRASKPITGITLWLCTGPPNGTAALKQNPHEEELNWICKCSHNPFTSIMWHISEYSMQCCCNIIFIIIIVMYFYYSLFIFLYLVIILILVNFFVILCAFVFFLFFLFLYYYLGFIYFYFSCS